MHPRGQLKFGLKLALSVLTVLATCLPNATTLGANVDMFSDTLSTIKSATPANHTLQFTINDAWDAGETLTIDFPDTFVTSGFANTEAEDYDIEDDNSDQNIVASGGCSVTINEIEVTAVNTTNDIFTFTRCAGDASITSGSVIEIMIGNHTDFGSAGNDQITNQTDTENATDPTVSLGGTFGGTGSLDLEIIADDDVTVTATVVSRITCSFTGLTTNFNALTGPVATADNNTTITVSTNTQNGFILTVRDEGNGANPGLYKGSGVPYLIGSSDNTFADTATLVNEVDGYGIQASTSGGSGAAVNIAARYNQTGSTVGGFERIATTLASANASVSNRTITIAYKAAVSGLVPAGTYTDTVTYVCTGIF